MSAALAAEFGRILREWLTPEEYRTVCEENAKGNPWCASHDVCDPNAAMEDACAALGLSHDTDGYDAINAAWDVWRATETARVVAARNGGAL